VSSGVLVAVAVAAGILGAAVVAYYLFGPRD
jgi:hypothetical protein